MDTVRGTQDQLAVILAKVTTTRAQVTTAVGQHITEAGILIPVVATTTAPATTAAAIMATTIITTTTMMTITHLLPPMVITMTIIRPVRLPQTIIRALHHIALVQRKMMMMMITNRRVPLTKKAVLIARANQVGAPATTKVAFLVGLRQTEARHGARTSVRIG